MTLDLMYGSYPPDSTNPQIGVVVIPMMEVKVSESHKYFNKDPVAGQGVLAEYYNSMKGQEKATPCRIKCTMSADNCNQLDIRRDTGDVDGNEYTRPSK